MINMLLYNDLGKKMAVEEAISLCNLRFEWFPFEPYVSYAVVE